MAADGSISLAGEWIDRHSDHWLTMFYNGNGAEMLPRGVNGDMNRDGSLAWLNLPLILPID